MGHWKTNIDTLAITSIFDDSNPEDYAAELLSVGSIPADWQAVAFNIQEFPQNWDRQEDWIFTDKIEVDFERAKETTRNRLREERAPLLLALDVEFQRNLETGKDNTSVISEKERLRDITTLPESCFTLEELKSLSCG